MKKLKIKALDNQILSNLVDMKLVEMAEKQFESIGYGPGVWMNNHSIQFNYYNDGRQDGRHLQISFGDVMTTIAKFKGNRFEPFTNAELQIIDNLGIEINSAHKGVYKQDVDDWFVDKAIPYKYVITINLSFKFGINEDGFMTLYFQKQLERLQAHLSILSNTITIEGYGEMPGRMLYLDIKKSPSDYIDQDIARIITSKIVVTRT